MERKYSDAQWKRFVTRLKSELTYYREKVEELEKQIEPTSNLEKKMFIERKQYEQDYEDLQQQLDDAKQDIDMYKNQIKQLKNRNSDESFLGSRQIQGIVEQNSFFNEDGSNYNPEHQHAWFFEGLKSR
ncbi:hypothetical protein [Bacillus solimangrovi]|uniref:Uncharacterized protein n=1 Tax=Bacillus solimangrovi TaxID=1305675 RepID=A0A1E5LBX6_9BACI|nr:hypothetical protein [Bacillus solimangrovi]OEH91592.1 hypothetical protein BFG57_04250 [Bacillus solimangrovi]